MLKFFQNLFAPASAPRATVCCAWCGHIRDGITWVTPASYLRIHGPHHQTSHGICPMCAKQQLEAEANS